MSRTAVELMFALISSAINGDVLPGEFVELYSDDILPELYSLSKRHNISHLVYLGLQRNSLISPMNKYYSEFYVDICLANIDYQRQKYEFDKLCKFFDDNKISFIPLKGAVIRNLYPEPWMRTSCDIDILVRQSDIEKCVNEYGKISEYSDAPIKGDNHISVHTKSGVNIEFHYNLAVQSRVNLANEVLSDIWNDAYVHKAENSRYTMNIDVLVFYHFVHMAKHFIVGGCGIRPFLDLHIMKGIIQTKGLVDSGLFVDSGIEKFVDIAMKLSNVWFCNERHTVATKRLEEYILAGGSYGTIQNQANVQLNKKGGKINYIISRIFLPYQSLKRLYPILEKHRCLMPIMQVARWFRTIRNGRFEHSINEIKHSVSTTDGQRESMKKLLEDLGL